MKRITTARAQQICSNWHGGQWSAFYQFASSGIYTIENHLEYLKECEDCLHPEYALHPGELTQRQEQELNSLKKYFIAEGLKNGLGTEYHTHELYGYLIPYLTEETPDELANNVKAIAYMK